MSQNELRKYLGKKEIQTKNRKGKGGALAGHGLASGPLAEAGLAHEHAFPLPVPAPASTREGQPRRATVASRLGSTAAWRACGGVDMPWSATRSPRSRLLLPPMPFALFHSPSLALACPNRRSGRATARHYCRRSELLSLAALASSFESSATSNSASPSRTPFACSTALSKLGSPVRARRSELELRRPLGSCGSSPSSPPLPTFSSALAPPRHRAPFPVLGSRSTSPRWLGRGEQRRRVRHARRRASSGAR